LTLLLGTRAWPDLPVATTFWLLALAFGQLWLPFHMNERGLPVLVRWGMYGAMIVGHAAGLCGLAQRVRCRRIVAERLRILRTGEPSRRRFAIASLGHARRHRPARRRHPHRHPPHLSGPHLRRRHPSHPPAGKLVRQGLMVARRAGACQGCQPVGRNRFIAPLRSVNGAVRCAYCALRCCALRCMP
jgi:hypothetical protein